MRQRSASVNVSLRLVVMGLAACLCLNQSARAASVALAWDMPTNNTDGTPLTDLAGYKVYVASAPGAYSNFVDVGLVTNSTVTDLENDQAYSFVVTAYNADGSESDFSIPLQWSVPASGPLHHFAWDPIAANQTSGVPFRVTVVAQDIENNTVTGFVGKAYLSSAVGIVPTNTPSFAGGVWSGQVTVTAAGTNIVLKADDGAGHTGMSGAFNADVRLVVSSTFDVANPPVGTRVYRYGTPLVCSVYPGSIVNGDTQYVCSGWTGSGSVPVSGAGTNTTSIVMKRNSSITWRWSTNYFLSISAAGAGVVDEVGGWKAAGTNLTIIASPSDGYHLASWSGNIDGCTTNGNLLLVPMDGPRTIGASFEPDSGPVDHFEWGSIVSPQTAGAPFQVTITARDGHDVKASSFEGGVALSGLSEGATIIGTARNESAVPMQTSAGAGRTEIIYLTNEIGRACWLKGLALDVIKLPAEALGNWTIRIKHTDLSGFSNSGWESNGWTTVYQQDSTVSSTGWVNFAFSTPFYYNGASNLMVVFTFGNTNTGSQLGRCRYTADTVPSRYRVRYGTALLSKYGDPLGWSSNPVRNMTPNLPNIRLQTSEIVPVSPSFVDGFNKGVWTGYIAVPSAAAAIVVLADDGAGHKGATTAFEVVSALAGSSKSSFSPGVQPGVDSDGDGLSDSQEALAGTDPRDPNSVLKLLCAVAADSSGRQGITIFWSGVAGAHYSVERSTNLLGAPAFVGIVSNVPGESPTTSYTDVTATGSGPFYYRVRVEP